jgi:hypothetical protein
MAHPSLRPTLLVQEPPKLRPDDIADTPVIALGDGNESAAFVFRKPDGNDLSQDGCSFRVDGHR